MNELKFGHRVICKEDDNHKIDKGRFITKIPYPKGVRYAYKPDGVNDVYECDHCELDPEADEFLIGDEVEFSQLKTEWFRGIYDGKREGSTHPHFSKNTEQWKYCRYPQKQSKKVEIEIGSADEIKLLKNGQLIQIINIIDNE